MRLRKSGQPTCTRARRGGHAKLKYLAWCIPQFLERARVSRPFFCLSPRLETTRSLGIAFFLNLCLVRRFCKNINANEWLAWPRGFGNSLKIPHCLAPHAWNKMASKRRVQNSYGMTVWQTHWLTNRAREWPNDGMREYSTVGPIDWSIDFLLFQDGMFKNLWPSHTKWYHRTSTTILWTITWPALCPLKIPCPQSVINLFLPHPLRVKPRCKKFGKCWTLRTASKAPLQGKSVPALLSNP